MVSLRRLLLAAITLLAMIASARADDLHDLIDRLGAESFADKEQAVTALGELGDGHAVPALKALSDGLLYRTSDGHVVVAEQSGDTYKLFDPVDHAALGEAKDDAIDKVRVNNRLRGTISGALSRLTLVSTSRDDRLDAARDALKHLSEVSTPALERALVTGPRLLVLDEPTEGIQPSIIKEIERVIRDLAARGDIAILLVEQYFEFARALADTYVVMDRGEVVLSGLARDMVEGDVRRYLTV